MRFCQDTEPSPVLTPCLDFCLTLTLFLIKIAVKIHIFKNVEIKVEIPKINIIKIPSAFPSSRPAILREKAKKMAYIKQK